MSEFGGLWKHVNNQHALVPPKMECGGGIKKRSHTRYPSYGGNERERLSLSLLLLLLLLLLILLLLLLLLLLL